MRSVIWVANASPTVYTRHMYIVLSLKISNFWQLSARTICSIQFKMLLKSTLAISVLVATALADSAGYVLPSSGSASTTQFYLGPELSSGTACGVDALPNGKSTSGKQGGGPGYLYVLYPGLTHCSHSHLPFRIGSDQPTCVRSQPFSFWCWRSRWSLWCLLQVDSRLIIRDCLGSSS